MLLLIFPDTTCCWVHVPMQGHPRMLQSHVPHTWVSQGLGRLMPAAQSKDPGTAFGYFRLQAGLDLFSALSSLLGVAGAGCKARQAPGGTKWWIVEVSSILWTPSTCCARGTRSPPAASG